MKRLFVIFLVLLLAITGCTSDTATEGPEIAEETDSNDLQEEVIEEIFEEDEIEEAVETPIEEAEENLYTEEKEEEKEPLVAETPAYEDLTEAERTETEVDETNNLKIKGLVEKELSLTLDQLKEMDIIFEADFYSLNNFGTTGYTHFKGVKLWNLLKEKALIREEASKISIVAHDGYTVEFTVEDVQREYIDETDPTTKYPMIIAWEENGEEYSPSEGAPYKLVVGQKEPGDINKPNWVSNIDVILVE